MARRNERGLELSFHKHSGRWCKVIDGKREYFGYGRGVSDRDSYKGAVEKFRAMMEGRSARANNLADQQAADAVIHQLHRAATEDDPTPMTKDQLAALVKADYMPQAIAAVMNPEFAPEVPIDTDITTLTDAYLAAQRIRRDITRSKPEALPRKQRLSTTSYRGLAYGVTSFRDYAVDQARITDLSDTVKVEKLLRGYRQNLEAKMVAGKLAPTTVNAKVVYLGPLFTWLWKARHIAELPRCLDEVMKKYSPKPSAKPLAITIVKKLWEKADGRSRAMIALGLNAGLYAMELATIKGEHIADGYLAKHRNKTGVPYRIKLWPVTQKLVEKYRDHHDPQELLWTTKKGHPLVHEGPKAKTDSVSQWFSKLAEEAGVEATWSQLRDTSATLIEKLAGSNKAVTSQFLAHADPRTARFYVEQDPRELPTKELDAALDKLCKLYDLLHEFGAKTND